MLGEMWDCQLGNLTAGKVSGGGGRRQFLSLAMYKLGTFSNVSAGIQGGSESSISSQQDQDCIFMPIWKDASYFEDDSLKSVDDAQLQDQDGTHDDCKFQGDCIDDHTSISGLPKNSPSLAVKRIFRLPQRQPSLGLWLISWQCKKQTVVATSTTEAEYVAAASCCGQVLWIQNQLLDYGYNFMDTVIYIDNTSTICIIENPVQHSKTKHIEIRHHFIRDCNAKKLIQMAKIDTQHNVADLLTKGFDAGRFQYLVSSIGMLNP
ncbi:hypothetical protein Tco_0173112 [Tanacetum coccineum]